MKTFEETRTEMAENRATNPDLSIEAIGEILNEQPDLLTLLCERDPDFQPRLCESLIDFIREGIEDWEVEHVMHWRSMEEKEDARDEAAMARRAAGVSND